MRKRNANGLQMNDEIGPNGYVKEGKGLGGWKEEGHWTEGRAEASHYFGACIMANLIQATFSDNNNSRWSC